MKNFFLCIFLCLSNATTIICFTQLAMHFECPWLVLLALCFYHWYKPSEKKE